MLSDIQIRKLRAPAKLLSFGPCPDVRPGDARDHQRAARLGKDHG
jgi:hypothetical protein